MAEDNAGVPVECTAGGRLRFGVDQYLAAAAVPDIDDINPC